MATIIGNIHFSHESRKILCDLVDIYRADLAILHKSSIADGSFVGLRRLRRAEIDHLANLLGRPRPLLCTEFAVRKALIDTTIAPERRRAAADALYGFVARPEATPTSILTALINIATNGRRCRVNSSETFNDLLIKGAKIAMAHQKRW